MYDIKKKTTIGIGQELEKAIKNQAHIEANKITNIIFEGLMLKPNPDLLDFRNDIEIIDNPSPEEE